MSFVRWVPIIGLFVALAVVPGALAHHCNGGDESASFETQSAIAGAPPAVFLLSILIPILGVLAAIGIAIPSMRRTPPT
jgi:hypothetical protein